MRRRGKKKSEMKGEKRKEEARIGGKTRKGDTVREKEGETRREGRTQGGEEGGMERRR